MEAVELIPAPLTRDAFAPFGDVIEVDGAHRIEINNGTTERFHNLAAVDVTSEGGHPLINIFRGQPRQFLPRDRRLHRTRVVLPM